MECLENLVGIYSGDCVCVTDGLTPEQVAEIRKSTSGLYLDKHLEGGVSLSDVRVLDNCDEYLKIARDSIEGAVRRFSDDLMVSLSRRYSSTKPRFLGELGRLTYVGNLPVSKKYQLLKISPKPGTSSGIVTVNGIRLITSSDGMVDVRVFAVRKGETNGQEILSTTITTRAHKFASAELNEPLSLPLFENGHDVEYFIAWERPDGLDIFPKDNSVKCNCTGGNAYDGYVKLSGGETDDLETLIAADDYAHGFSIDAEIKCETGNIVCKQFDASNDVAIISAWAILYKSGELLNEFILNSPEITRFTLLNREYLWGKRNHFKKEYETRVAYLASEIDLSSSDCFICREGRMFVGNVFG